MSNYQAKNSALISLLLLFTVSVHAQQYMYPVAVFSDSAIGFIHQVSHEKIELYTWDSITKTVEPSLPSRFCPAHIALLPGNMGFSFIDNGIIRIKFFHKRSPKSLEMTEPLYNINAVSWMQEACHDSCFSDNAHRDAYGYFSAQYHDSYALARVDLDARISHIIFSKTADFLYPQKSGTNLFFIARSTENTSVHYRLCKIKFDSNFDSRDQKITDQEPGCTDIKKTIHTEIGERELSDLVFLDFDTQPICFLTIDQELERQSLSLVAYVSHTDSFATFSYYQITLDKNLDKKKLFDFALPTSFLFTQGPNQLYEHIVPLLPKKIGETIYFSHATSRSYPTCSDCDPAEPLESLTQNRDLVIRDSNINIFSYNIATQAIEQVTHAREPGEHFFCPLKAGDSLCYGGTVRSQ
jgi:hypothetical protein